MTFRQCFLPVASCAALIVLVGCASKQEAAAPSASAPSSAPSGAPKASTKTSTTASKSTAGPSSPSFEVGNGVRVQTRVLPNGLTILIAKNPRAPLVSVYHWVKAGSLHEKPGTTGIAHLFEHMMFRPLGEGKQGFFDTARALGAEVNANTRFESTVYTTTVPGRNLGPLLEAEAARFKTLTVTDALLDVERRAVWSEYSTKFDADPSFDLWYALYGAAFPKHPYGWFIIGMREDLPKITARDCNQFFQAFYRPNNVGLVIAGDVDINATMALVEKHYSSWEKGKDSALPPPFEGRPGPVKAVSKLPAGGRKVLAGWRLPPFTAETALRLELANHILFDSSNDLASRRFVDREKLAASVGSFSFGYGNGMLTGVAQPLPGVADDRLAAAFTALKADFDTLPVAHYEAYRKEFQVGVAEGLERNESIVDALATAWGKYGDPTLVAKWSRQAPAVSHAEMRTFLDGILREDNFVYVTTPTTEAPKK
jgi:predicted Zn-dependent peptidase